MNSHYEWADNPAVSPDQLDTRSLRLEALAPSPMEIFPDGFLDSLITLLDEMANIGHKWLPLGPSVIQNGQPEGLVSGRVRAMAVSPDGKRIYAGSANGGVWYTSDGGLEWSPVGSWAQQAANVNNQSNQINLSVGSLDVHFGAAADGSEDIVYVGTGEVAGRTDTTKPGGKFGGIGVLRLKDSIATVVSSPGRNPWQREAKNLTDLGISQLLHKPNASFSNDPAQINTFVAATNEGLYFRNGTFSEDQDWRQENTGIFAGSTGRDLLCSDALWNARGLFVAVVSDNPSQTGIYHSLTGTGAAYNQITLPDHKSGERMRIAASDAHPERIYVLSLANGGGSGHAALWQIDLSHDNQARRIAMFPRGIFTSELTEPSSGNFETKNSQNFHDNAIYVDHAGGKDVVYVGGAAIKVSSDWHAQIYRLEVNGTAAVGDLSVDFESDNQVNAHEDPTYRGRDIHPDVHELVERGGVLFSATDGGVYSRTNAGEVRNYNNGLAVTEPTYIASHPVHDGIMAAGTQDNGTIRRVGDTVWKIVVKADGGGVAFHAGNPTALIRQYVQGNWNTIPASTPPSILKRLDGVDGDELNQESKSDESKISSFYSAVDTAKGRASHLSRVVLGTHRLWYTENWNTNNNTASWVTLPSRVDPYATAGGNSRSDSFRTDDALDPVLSVKFFEKAEGVENFDGTKILVLCRNSVYQFNYDHATLSWARLKLDSFPEEPAKCCAFDVATPALNFLSEPGKWTDIGPHNPENDTFYVTTLGRTRRRPDGSLQLDPNFDTLWWYNGSGQWYPTGLATTPIDLNGGTAGCPASAHSVLVDVDDKNIVYVGTRLGVFKGTIDLSGEHPSWDWEPMMSGAPIAVVEDLSMFKEGDRKYLRAAMVSRGVWEAELSASPHSQARLFIRSIPTDTRRKPLPLPTTPILSTNTSFFSNCPDIFLINRGSAPWGARPPTEVEFSKKSLTGQFSQNLCDLYILAHYRETVGILPTDVAAHVFLHRRQNISTFTEPVTESWRTAVVDNINGRNTALPDDWVYLGEADPPAKKIDARMPRSMKLEVNLTGAVVRRSANRKLAYIMVVLFANSDPAVAADFQGATLEEIVRQSPKVGVHTCYR